MTLKLVYSIFYYHIEQGFNVYLPTVWMLPSWSLFASLVSHSVDTKVLFSEIMNQITLFTATNNYDYVLYILHVICMSLRLLRGHVLHHSIERKMDRKPPKNIILSGQPQTPMESPYEEAHMYMTAKVLTGLHTSSYPIGSRAIYLYFFYFF